MDQGSTLGGRVRIVAALALIVVPAARAQGAPPGVLEGTVYDSLINAPLAGAQVWLRGTPLSATTDARGHYRIAGVPAGRYVASFGHPELDSIGVPQLARPVVVLAGTVSRADFGVPALVTLQRALCGARPPMIAFGLGAVFGTVRDAETGARLAGARVEISWLSINWTRGRPFAVDRSRDEIRTDSLGNFYQCDVPSGEVFTVAASVGSAATGTTEVLIGPRGVLRHDLWVSRDSASLALDSLTGLLIGHATLAGVVRDETGRPVAGAHALLDDAYGEAETDAAGTFSLRRMPAGSQMLMVRAIGYGAVRTRVDLRNADTVRAAVAIHSITVLDTIRVTARRGGRLLGELAERLRSGGGSVLAGNGVRRAADFSTVLQGLPFASVERQRGYYTLLSRAYGRQCLAHIWIDGFQAVSEQLQHVQARHVTAVEWYPRGWSAPSRFAPNDGCGVLLVWTDSYDS